MSNSNRIEHYIFLTILFRQLEFRMTDDRNKINFLTGYGSSGFFA